MLTLADIVLVAHALVVLFNVGGLVAIWIGAALGWRWIRNFWFRAVHLGLMAYIAVQSLVGLVCPLTILEDALRQAGSPSSGFIQRWVGSLLYYDLPASVFTTAYVLFALAVLATYYVIKPVPRSAVPTPPSGPG